LGSIHFNFHSIKTCPVQVPNAETSRTPERKGWQDVGVIASPPYSFVQIGTRLHPQMGCTSTDLSQLQRGVVKRIVMTNMKWQKSRSTQSGSSEVLSISIIVI
jgi:hypothetical protein